jgi:glycosyltransferase involved in cell wall biosynthesis
VSDRVQVVLVVGAVAGGIAAHVRGLTTDLISLDVDVMVMAPPRSLRVMRLDDAAAAIPAPVGRPSPWAWWTVRRTLRRLTSGRVVVHAHGLRAGLAASAAGNRTPLVVTWHNAPLGGALQRGLHARLERRVARRADLTLAASADLAARARRAGAAAVRVVLVGSPTSAPGRSRDQVRAVLGVPAEMPLVLAVARLHPQKRLDVLVAAAAGWAAAGTGARRVLVAGEGPARADLTRQIVETGAPVTLLGAREDVPDLLEAADVVVLTSEWEARSLAAQEALRAGVPLVCTATGGLPGLVGDAAVLVPVGDALAVRAAVDRVLGDPVLRATLTARGRARAATWPSDASAAAELRDLYLDLRSRSGRRNG